MGRKLELRQVPWGDGSKRPDGSEPKLDYREQLLVILRAPSDPRAGVTFEDMERRLPLIGKIKAAEGYVLLRDDEWREIRDAFKAYRFPSVIEAVAEMGRDIEGAETVEIKEVEKAPARRTCPPQGSGRRTAEAGGAQEQ